MNWDTVLFHTINGWTGQSPALDWFMLQCSTAGNFVALVVVWLVWQLWINWRQGLLAASVLGVLIGVGDFTGTQLKIWMARPRPCQVWLNVNELTGCGGDFSMPSNHALNAATAAAFLGVLFPSTRWVGGILMVLIGLSRVSLGAHYPTDVIAGWAIGGILGMTAGYLMLQATAKSL